MPEQAHGSVVQAATSATRNSGIDLLRVVGICAVVFGHVVATETTMQWVYAWHVPLFFFLSGWFWRRGRTFWAELRVRARSLLVPYAFWLAAGLVMLGLLGLLTPDGLVAILRGGTSARGIFAAFWFVTALFCATMLARLLDPLPAWIAWVVAIAGTAASYALPLGGLPLALGHAFPGLLFLLCGALAARISVPWWFGIVLLAASALAIATIPLAHFDMKPLNLGTPLVGGAIAVAISWGLTICFAHMRAAWVEIPASAGITVVLLHTFVLFYLAESGLRVIVILAIVMFVTWSVAIGLRFTPLSLVTSGAPMIRRTPRP